MEGTVVLTNQSQSAPVDIKASLLIVDDDEGQRDSLKSLFTFKHPDWRIHAVGSVEEAETCINSEGPFDVVLTDMKMSEGDEAGLAIIAAARSKSCVTAVVVLTAFAALDNVYRALDKGADQYVDKSMPDAEVIRIEVVENFMQRAEWLRKTYGTLEDEPTITDPQWPLGSVLRKIEPKLGSLDESAGEFPDQSVESSNEHSCYAVVTDRSRDQQKSSSPSMAQRRDRFRKPRKKSLVGYPKLKDRYKLKLPLKILESFRGKVERIDGDTALVKLIDREGKASFAEYSAAKLAKRGIGESDYFNCYVSEVDNGVAVTFEPMEVPDVPDEEWEHNFEKMFEDLKDYDPSDNY